MTDTNGILGALRQKVRDAATEIQARYDDLLSTLEDLKTHLATQASASDSGGTPGGSATEEGVPSSEAGSGTAAEAVADPPTTTREPSVPENPSESQSETETVTVSDEPPARPVDPGDQKASSPPEVTEDPTEPSEATETTAETSDEARGLLGQ